VVVAASTVGTGLIVFGSIVFAVVVVVGLLALRQHNRMFPKGWDRNGLGSAVDSRVARDEVHLAVGWARVTALARGHRRDPRRTSTWSRTSAWPELLPGRG
jgi:hypothetical protein